MKELIIFQEVFLLLQNTSQAETDSGRFSPNDDESHQFAEQPAAFTLCFSLDSPEILADMKVRRPRLTEANYGNDARWLEGLRTAARPLLAVVFMKQRKTKEDETMNPLTLPPFTA